MDAVIIDVDDTLVSTGRRKWAVWRHILGREIPTQVVENLSSRQVLEKFAQTDGKLWNRFWRVLLCWEEAGTEFLKFDEPLPFAVAVLNEWSKEFRIVYLTGRTINMYYLTLDELRAFGFPVGDVDLIMAPDLEAYLSSEIEVRTQLFTSASKMYRVVRVVDDYPRYFTIYSQFRIPDRIGLLRPKRFSEQDYLIHGATKVIKGWEQLQKNKQ